MNRKLSLTLAGVLALGLSSCIYVHAKGNLSGEFLDEDDDFFDLTCEFDDALVDPEYDLELHSNLWKTYATWRVRFAGEPADVEQAFARAREAVLRRIEREGGEVTKTHEKGSGEWGCEFRLDDEPGEASVRVLEDEEESARPHRIEVRWEESS